MPLSVLVIFPALMLTELFPSIRPQFVSPSVMSMFTVPAAIFAVPPFVKPATMCSGMYIFGASTVIPFTVSSTYHTMGSWSRFICSFVSATPTARLRSLYAVAALSRRYFISSWLLAMSSPRYFSAVAW
ncbi:MAG: hypothetical protein BWY96_03134 [Spirochaetes bacterium ADurb.BinA120]|nr:MAG: hypothetical protein BWY96_03134 [Spirochaetes bacterium ADurb.BinA120]